MTEREKEEMRKRLVKQFTLHNRNWTYNGTYFEMSARFGKKNTSIWVTFRNKMSCLELEMQYLETIAPWGRNMPAVQLKLTGEDRFDRALDAMADYLTELETATRQLNAQREQETQVYGEKLCAAVRMITEGERHENGDRADV